MTDRQHDDEWRDEDDRPIIAPWRRHVWQPRLESKRRRRALRVNYYLQRLPCGGWWVPALCAVILAYFIFHRPILRLLAVLIGVQS
jgi:hypothetical protein